MTIGSAFVGTSWRRVERRPHGLLTRRRVAVGVLAAALGTSGCLGESARIDGELRAPDRSTARTTSLAGIEVRLLAASESLRATVTASCERYLRADAALSDARFRERIGGTAQSRARALARFRALDDSAAAIEARLLAELDSAYVARTVAVAVADSLGAFSLRRVPPGSYALAARSIAHVPPFRWWADIDAPRGQRVRVELTRPAHGHLTCFDPARRSASLRLDRASDRAYLSGFVPE